MRSLLAALGFGLLASAAFMFQSGWLMSHFDIEWDEEVQLHDGQTVTIHLRRTFARIGILDRRAGIHQSTEISFDAGGKIGKFKRQFKRYDISFVERKGDQWFLGLVQITGTPPVKWVDFTYPDLAIGQSGELGKGTLVEFPPEFLRFNIMPITPDTQGIAKFNGTTLTVAAKMAHWQAFPRGAGDDGIIRPRKTSQH